MVFFACAIGGCYESHLRAGDPPDEVPVVHDAGVIETCIPAASLGAITGVELRDPDIVHYEGCEDACLVVYDGQAPALDPDALASVRAALASLDDDEPELGPCCPSRGEAGGTCIIVREDALGEWCYPGMWLIGASGALPGGRGCYGVRVEPAD